MSNTSRSGEPPMAAPAGAPRTVAEALGQIVWLMSQSPAHREVAIKDLEWLIMPAVLHEQFRIFRFGPLPGIDQQDVAPAQGLSKHAVEQMPLGVAIWARLSEAAEKKLENGIRLAAAEWRSGDRVWLVELISPFAKPGSKVMEAMLLDLIQGPFRDTPFNLHRTDPSTGVREKIHMHQHVAARSS